MSNKFDELIPASVGEAFDRVRPFGPHPTLGDLERLFTCTGCGMHILVGPCFEQIDPESFLGVVCGCLTPEPLDGPDDVATAAGTPGNTREGTPDG